MGLYERKKIEYENKFLEMVKNQKLKSLDNFEYQKIPIEYSTLDYTGEKITNPKLKKDLKNVYDEFNNKLDKKFCDTLKKILEENKDEYYIGIHRTANDQLPLLEEGLRQKYGSYSIHNHVQIMHNFLHMLREIRYAYTYKGSTSCLIVKIPKKDVDRNIQSDEREPIFFRVNNDDNEIYLCNKYILGYVPVQMDNMPSIFIENRCKEYIPENSEMLYDETIEKLVNCKTK